MIRLWARRVPIFLLIPALLAVLSPGVGAAAPSVSVSKPRVATTTNSREFRTLAQSVLAQRNDAYIGAAAQSVRMSLSPLVAGESLDKEVATQAGLRQRGQELAQTTPGVRYSRHTTDVTVTNATIDASGKSASARLTEVSRYYFVRIVGDEPEFTAQSVEREARYVIEQGHWRLASISSIQAGGLAPINDVVVSGGAASPVTGPLAVRGTAQNTARIADRRNTPSDMKGGSRFGAAPAVAAPAVAASYSYWGMANYAVRYWQNYNGDYKTYSSRGGDCTNFLSQALLAGGWPEQSGWYQSTGSWWYNQIAGNPTWLENASWPWINAWYWYWFAINSGRTYILGNVWWMGLADVLQLDFDRDGALDHSMLVTATSSSGEKYLTYHTTNTLNRPLSDIINAYPSAWYYAHRT